ncbi:PDDEXK nuclease domain-containing protein [Caedibacter taeniospiralis]|jgi:hypothetical protein|uniref:PDDEXK nuclease domain-containing protein n=1 Tax=Caedibacter taeniospiralis TaxID=28907 RepID=UPI0037BE4725
MKACCSLDSRLRGNDKKPEPGQHNWWRGDHVSVYDKRAREQIAELTEVINAGKMNFYLSVVDDLLRAAGDNPSIGLILCRSKVGVVAEYALRDMTKPIGLAEYRLEDALPENLKTALPTIEELEAELAKDLGGEDE